MINIFFVPGMFGSTIEYVLRNYTYEHTPINAFICKDGSMHSYQKQAHLKDNQALAQFKINNQTCKITTPIYPFSQQHLPEILINFDATDNDQNILVYADSQESAEINMLFQFHKIAFSPKSNFGLEIFSGNNEHNIVNWNPAYTSWLQMQPWEWREWFSLFYVSWIQEWQESKNQVPAYFLKIKNTNMLFDPLASLNKVINFCHLTAKPGLDDFVQEWKLKQQYIIDEFNLLGQIVTCTTNNQQMLWEPVNIVAEAIVQQRLRAAGYEIRCDGLNTFPTDSKTLYNLLELV
jgi:hypothetical protein